MSFQVIPIILIPVLITTFFLKMPKNIPEQKIFTKITKTPKSIMNFKLTDKLDDFVENHFGKKYVVDTYTIVKSDTNVLTKITDIKIKVFIVKKNSKAWNNSNKIILMSIKITPTDIKISHILQNSHPLGEKIVPQNSNCQK
jgi:hypothetical protein